MSKPYQDKLRKQAELLASAVREQLAVDVTIPEDSFREYSVAVKIGQAGQATIYYSPKKNRFTLTPQGLPANITARVTQVWNDLEAGVVSKPSTPSAPKKADKRIIGAKADFHAFVDGSYNKQHKSVGYGAIILKGEDEQERLSGRADTDIESRQVGGELVAVMRVLDWCQQNGIPAIDIYYDYKGIEMWATHRWKRNKPLTQDYAAYVRSSGIRVYWHKVEAHSGNYWNDIADKLARQGTLKTR